MTEYRIYTLDKYGHFGGFEPAVCESDAEAIEKANRLCAEDCNVEIWSGSRLVKRQCARRSGTAIVSHEIKDGRMMPKKQ